MWARTVVTQCVSLNRLRNRGLVPQFCRQNWQRYRCFDSAASESSGSRPESAQLESAWTYLSHNNDDSNTLCDGNLYQLNENGENLQRGTRQRFCCLNSRDESQYRIPNLLLSPPIQASPHLHRARITLVACLALDEARNKLRSNNRTTRFFSTSDDPPNKEQNSGDDTQRTEPDFAEYLAGTTDEHALKGDTEPTPTEAPIDLEGTEVPLDDHTETYKYIRRRQQNSWELAREKTTENVQRALAGNVAICAAKLAAFISSGSSSMFSEFIHSVVDCGNQSLLLLGLRDAGNRADRKHPYGYGKSVYFYALVSALGTFFLGAGVSGTQAWAELMEPSLTEITWQVWSVLAFSFVVDGYVLAKTVVGIRESMPKKAKVAFFSYVRTLRDPATIAVLLEDGAACLGILIAIGGIAASSTTGLPVFDGMAGLAISGLLASMGLVLVRINQRFLLGQAVDPEIINGIERILRSQKSIDGVHSIQSQWTGPDSFSFKAEVDFDGTYLAGVLMPRYQNEFLQVQDDLDSELRVLLSWYAEDVMRTVEREVKHVEAEIRRTYPGAEFIELEPMSKDAERFAIDDAMHAQLRRMEIESLNRVLRSLYRSKPQPKTDKKSGDDEKSSS